MEGEKGVECGSGGGFRGAVGGVGFEGMWCGRCEEIGRSGFWEGISTRSGSNSVNKSLQDEGSQGIVGTRGDNGGSIWGPIGRSVRARLIAMVVVYHWALLKYFEPSCASSAIPSLSCSSELFSRVCLSPEGLAVEI